MLPKPRLARMRESLLFESGQVTGLVVVIEEAKCRRRAFKAAMILYLLGLVDMGIKVLISGVVGWSG